MSMSHSNRVLDRRQQLTCTAIAETATNLAVGFQTVPIGSFIAANVTFIGGSGLLLVTPTVEVNQLTIIGFQIPNNTCDAIGPPAIKECNLERVCDDALVVRGTIERVLRITPVLSNSVDIGSGVYFVGFPTTRRVQQQFSCVVPLPPSKLEQTECKPIEYEICECKLCPGVACLDDTSQIIINGFINPPTPVPANVSTCISQSFRQFNAVRITLKKRKTKKNGVQAQSLVKLVSISPSSVTLPDVTTTSVNTGSSPCVTLNGCGLEKTVAVLVNNIVCADIQSLTDSNVVFRVPCAIPFVTGVLTNVRQPPLPTILPPTSQLVPVSVIDSCGRISDPVSLQINGTSPNTQCNCVTPVLAIPSVVSSSTSPIGLSLEITGTSLVSSGCFSLVNVGGDILPARLISPTLILVDLVVCASGTLTTVFVTTVSQVTGQTCSTSNSVTFTCP